jgi:deoxyhypusine synthase
VIILEIVKDFKWSRGMSVSKFFDGLSNVGFQSIELHNAAKTIVKMKKNNAKIYFTFTSNMMTSGLRGLFVQLLKLKVVDVCVTTVGSIEEDIMKSMGEDFYIGSYDYDDVSLHEKGINRVGNLLIKNKSYEKFEDKMRFILSEIYKKNKRICVVDLLREIGLMIDDENSLLYQAAKNDIPIFCPAITDGAFGFHLYMFANEHKDFIVDVVSDFSRLISSCSFDDKKGVICLGGGVSKHHAILGTLIKGGAEYAVYMTTARHYSGSMSGATTKEAKSWGKVKDDSDAVTVIGDVSINFPLVICSVLDELSSGGFIKDE